MSGEVARQSNDAGRVAIPNKLYFRIGEVSELTGVQPYTLRHWELEFPTLNPQKNDAGQRLYRKEDIEMVQEIERLLHRDGYTTAGARRLLIARKRGSGKKVPAAAKAAVEKVAVAATPAAAESAPAAEEVPADALGSVQEALDLMDENDRALDQLLEDG